MAASLYDQLIGWRRDTPAVRIERLAPCGPDATVFGPPLPAPVLREAIPVHTCTRCWCQQAMGLPCWNCGGPAWHWEPPAAGSGPQAVTTRAMVPW